MTFQEYIQNPTGIGTGVMSYRKMYDDLYHNKWDIIMTREAGKVEYSLWKDGSKACYCYIKIPSEVVPKFYYDVVIKMYVDKNSMSLTDCETQFFSNDPNFSFVFAYAFKHHKLTIPELEFKMSKTALTKKPVEKNPQLIINYIKSLYFAYIFMRKNGLFMRAKYMDAPQFDKKKFDKLIEDTDVKVQDRQLKGEEIAKEKAAAKKREQAKQNKPKRVEIDNKNTDLKIGTVKNVGNKYSPNKIVKKVDVKPVKNIQSKPNKIVGRR